jgi:acyl-CoA reductase-like NAD-dependent aldehyde dehydrogenase
LLEDRRTQFVEAIVAGEGVSRPVAERSVEDAVDRWVWYAGWSDKLPQVTGSSNPVAGPYFNFSLPEPTGVVGVIAPQLSSLLGLVSVLAPVLTTGNSAVVLVSESLPLPALTLGEVLATSDVPAGVVNLVSGRTSELAPVLAAHRDVDALDLAGAPAELATELERAAATNVKRVIAPESATDWDAEPTMRRLLAFVETKTVWHPAGT